MKVNILVYIIACCLISCSSNKPQIKTSGEHLIKPYYIIYPKIYRKKLLEKKKSEESNNRKLEKLNRDVAKINWLVPEKSTVEKAYKENKLILMYLRSVKSIDCERLESLTLLDNKIKYLLNKEFIPVWVDIDQSPELVNQDVNDPVTVPSFMFFMPEGNPIGGIKGFYYPDKLASILDTILDIWEENNKN